MTLAFALAALAILALIAEKRQNAAREKEWALERGALLQRIQAPQIAVQSHAERSVRKAPPPIPIDDDERYQEAHERRINGAD